MLEPWSQVLQVLQLFSKYKALQLPSVLFLLYLVSRKISLGTALPSFLREHTHSEAVVLLTTSQFPRFFCAAFMAIGHLPFFYLRGSSG